MSDIGTSTAPNAEQPKVQAPSPSPAVHASSSGWAFWAHRARFLSALTLPLLLETFDQTITATAQPHIASSFDKLDLQSWVGTSFILTSTAFLPLFANIADIFGRHATLQWSLILFLLGSSLCTGARSMPMLLGARGITGVGAAGITTVCRIIISDLRSMDENSVQTAVLTSMQGLGFILGPVIGGGLSSVSWRYVFGINLPVGCISIVLVYTLLRNDLRASQSSRPSAVTPDAPGEQMSATLLQKFSRVDWIGAFLFISSSILILYSLSAGSTSFSPAGWGDPQIIATLTAGGLIALAFPVWEYILGRPMNPSFSPKSLRGRTAHIEPMIPLHLFKSFDVCVSYFVALAGGMALFACLYFLSIYFVIVAGLSATKSGTQLLYLAPGLGAGTYIGIFIVKFTRQPRYPIILGAMIIPIGIGLLSHAVGINSSAQINGFLALTGSGLGLTFGPTSLQAQYASPKSLAAVVVTLNTFFRTFGGTVALAQLAAVLESKIRTYISSLVLSGTIELSDASLIYASIGSLGGGSGTGSGIVGLPPHLHEVIVAAYQHGTRLAFISLVPWCALPCLAAFFLSTVSDGMGPGEEEVEMVPTGTARPPPVEKGALGVETV